MAGKKKIFELKHPSSIKILEKVESLIEEVGKAADFVEEQTIDLAIAVTEAVNNAIIHGNDMDETKNVYLKFEIKKDKIVITVQDEGGGFVPENVNNPLDPENLMKDSGRGIFILKSLMDEVDFSITESGTELKMVKNR